MNPDEKNEFPDELREFESQLRKLCPKRERHLEQAVLLFLPSWNEKIPYPVTASTFQQFIRFVRKAQYTAGLFGGLVGSLFGAVLGGLCVFLAMSSPGALSFYRFETKPPDIAVQSADQPPGVACPASIKRSNAFLAASDPFDFASR